MEKARAVTAQRIGSIGIEPGIPRGVSMPYARTGIGDSLFTDSGLTAAPSGHQEPVANKTHIYDAGLIQGSF